MYGILLEKDTVLSVSLLSGSSNIPVQFTASLDPDIWTCLWWVKFRYSAKTILNLLTIGLYPNHYKNHNQ